MNWVDLATFFEMPFFPERITDTLWSFRLRDVADIFSEINGVNLVYPQKQLTDFIASTFWNKKKRREFWKTGLFSNELGSDINKYDFSILCNEMCQHLEDLQLSEWIFSKWPVHDVKTMHMSKRLIQIAREINGFLN